jgi:hypothetical protein
VADLFADLHLDDKPFFAELDAALAKAAQRSVKIKIDVDTTAARRKIDTLTRDRKAKIDVDVDTTAAGLEIDRLKAKIASLSSTQRVGVNTSGGSGGAAGGALGVLLGLSPALVPILAATAAGIGAIGASATASALGLGAFAGVAKTQFGEIQKSMQGVAKAQAALDAATTPAQRASALKALAAAYKAVDQNQVGVALGAQRLRKDWLALNKAIEPQVLVVFNGALAIGRQGLSYVQPLALSAAGALKGVEDNVGRALGSPYWRSFGQVISKETGPAIRTLSADLGNIVHGLAGLLVTFLPVTHQFEAGLESMTRGFANDGQSAGFKGFVSYIRTEGPIVVHTIGDIGSALGVILKDALPVGSILLQLVDDLAKLVVAADHVNPYIVTLGVGLLSVVKLAPLLTGLGGKIKGLGSSFASANPYAIAAGVAVAGVAGYMTVLSNESAKADKAVQSIKDNFNAFDTKKAQASIDAVTQSVKDAKTELAGETGGGKGFLGTVANIGQVINPFKSNSIQSEKDAIKAQTSALKDLKLAQASVSDNYAQIAYNLGLTRKQVDDIAKSAGISLDQFAVNPNDIADQKLIAKAYAEINKQAGLAGNTIQQQGKADVLAMQALSAAVANVAQKTGEAFSSATDVLANFQVVSATKTKSSLDKLQATVVARQTSLSQLQARDAQRGTTTLAQQQALTNAQTRLTAAQKAFSTAQLAARTPAEQLQAAYKDTLSTAQKFVTDTGSAIKRGLDPALIQELLQEGPTKAEPILRALLSDHSGKTIALANSTTKALQRISNEAVQFARVTALAVASPTDKLSRELPSITKVLQAQFALGGKANVISIAAKLDTSPERIAQLAHDFGVTLKGATAFVSSQGVKVPIKYDYPPGYVGPIPPGHAVQHVAIVYDYPSLQPGGSVFSQQVPSYSTPFPGGSGQRHADGSFIRGPGGSRGDMIPALLSAGEFVVNAKATERNRALLEAINAPRFAAGGAPGLLPLPPRAFNLPTGGLGSTPVYTAALAAAQGSLSALLATAVQFIQRDLPAALKSGASGISSATQGMIDQLAGLRDSYRQVVADNVKAQAELATARKKDETAATKDKKSADTALKAAIKNAADAQAAVDKLAKAGPAITTNAGFKAAEASILSYSSRLQRAANQNDTLTTAIGNAQGKLDAARQAFKDYAAQVEASVVATGDFTTALQANIVVQANVDTLTASVSDATKALQDAQTAYDNAFGTKASAQLEDLTTAQDIYNATVTKYGAGSANAAKAAQDLADAQGRAATASANLMAAQGALARQQDLLTAAQNGRAVTGADIVANLTSSVAAAKAFAADINTLKANGLGQTALQQILAQGPTVGAAFAHALANDLGDISTVNDLQGQLQTSATTLGQQATSWFNQTGVDTAQGILDGLKSKQAELTAYMDSLGQELAAAFRTSLGIHSPSVVMADLAAQIPAGVAVGIERQRHAAVRAAQGLADAVAGAGSYGPGSAGPGSAPGTVAGGGVHIHGDVVIQDATDAAMFWQKADFYAAHNGRVS